MLSYLNVGRRRFGDDDRRGHDDGVRIVRDDRGGRRRLVLFLLQAESQPRAGARVRVAAEPVVAHDAVDVHGPAVRVFASDGAIDSASDGARESAGESKSAEEGAEEEEKIILLRTKSKNPWPVKCSA